MVLRSRILMGLPLPLPVGCRELWEAEAGSGGGAVPWRDSVRERGDFENCFVVARGAVRSAVSAVVQRTMRL